MEDIVDGVQSFVGFSGGLPLPVGPAVLCLSFRRKCRLSDFGGRSQNIKIEVMRSECSCLATEDQVVVTWRW